MGCSGELHFRKDRPGAELILESADVEEARHVLKTLPLVKEALIDFDIIPLKPYPGVARLFAEYA